MKLIDDWHKCWTYLSIQCNGIGVAICATYGALYDELKDNFPPKYMAALTASVFVLGIIGRVVSQAPKDEQK